MTPLIALNNAGLALTPSISSTGIDSRVRVLRREFVTTLAVSLISLQSSFADLWNASGAAFFRGLGVSTNAATYSALALPVIVIEKILAAQWMASLAMSFGGIDCGRTDTILDAVYARRNGSHMVRVDAPTIPANVVDDQSFGNWPDVVLKGNAVRATLFEGMDFHPRVTIAV